MAVGIDAVGKAGGGSGGRCDIEGELQASVGGDFGDWGSVADEFEASGVGGKFDDAPFEGDDGRIDEFFGDGEEAEVGISGPSDVFEFTALSEGFEFAVEFSAKFAVIGIGRGVVVP